MNKFTNIACSTIKAVASADLSISNDLSNNNEKELKDLFNEKETGQNPENKEINQKENIKEN